MCDYAHDGKTYARYIPITNVIKVDVDEFDTVDSLVEFLGHLSKSLVSHHIEHVRVDIVLGNGSSAKTLKRFIEYTARTGILPFIDQGLLSEDYIEDVVDKARQSPASWIVGYFTSGKHYITSYYAELDPRHSKLCSIVGWPTYLSGRAKTTMSFLPDKKKIQRTDLRNGVIHRTDLAYYATDDELFIPVTRYASGFEKGGYYGGVTTDRCGTYYYYEPDSDYVLQASRFAMYRNKYTALKTLLEMYASSSSSRTEKDIRIFNHAREIFQTYIPGILSLFEFYGENVRKSMPYVGFHAATRRENIPKHLIDLADQFMMGNVVKYKGVTYDPTSKGVTNKDLMTRMYAHEDVLDESLCEMTRMMNIDVLILTHMVGTNRLVTEVLDTRPRFSMRDNLYELT